VNVSAVHCKLQIAKQSKTTRSEVNNWPTCLRRPFTTVGRNWYPYPWAARTRYQ